MLAYRLHQQSVLADFGRTVLEAGDVDTLLNEAARLCAVGMRARFCKVLEYRPEEDRLFLRAGVGWMPGIVGAASLSADMESPSGFAFQTGRPVISNHLAGEQGFRTPTLLAEHGVKRAINVLIAAGTEKSWGVLEVDSPDEGKFDEADMAFMQGFARVLGLAIEREQAKATIVAAKQQAVQARARQAKFQAIVENAPQKMWINRPDGSVDYFNAAWRTYTGQPVSAESLEWTEALHPDDRIRAIEKRASAIATRQPYFVELRLRRQSDGTYRRHLGEVAPVFEGDDLTAWIGVALDVEDARRAEAAAREAQEESQLIVDSATDYAILTTDPEGRITHWSPGAAAILGYVEDEVLGQPIDILFVPEDRDAGVPQQERETTRKEGVAPNQRWHLRKNGTRVFMTGSMRPLHDVSGIERGFMKIARDDTERRHASDALRANEARYRAILDTAIDAVVTIDEKGIIRDLNPATEQLFGYRVEELVGGPIARLMPEPYAAGHAKALNSYLRTGVRKVIGIGREVEGLRKDGSLIPLDLAIGEWRDVAGNRFFTGFMHDITKRKRAERALRQSEEQFRTLAESIPQLAWVADAEGQIYWYNRRWYEYTGTTLEEVRGWGWRHLHHPEHVQRAVQKYREAMSTGEPWQDTFPLRGADGRWRWFLSRAEPLRDAEGRVVRWFGTNTDVTAQREAEELQKILQREMSHRLKNSLALVSSLLTLQARSLDEAPRRALEEAAMRVHTVARVHDQLWRQTNTREIDLASFLSELCQAINVASPRHRTVCRVEPAIVSSDVAIPVGLLVNEMLTNAYKYAYPEGQEGEVRVSGTRSGDGRYRLEVRDQGRGLPEDFSFARAGKSLGMRVITALAAQLDAELAAENARPGARFVLLLPRQAEAADLPAPPHA